jgi:hypothetical protein
MKKPINTYLLLIFCSFFCNAQFQDFEYKRALLNVENQWHKIILPNDFYQKTKKELADVRIFGIDKNQDTIEVPFILRALRDKTSQKRQKLKLLNQSTLDGNYYYSFENSSLEIINQLSLELNLQNFDLKVSLEGSQDQKKWLSIVENRRITGIQNEFSNARFTKIGFNDANFRFFRLVIASNEDPKFSNAFFSKKVVVEGIFKTYNVENYELTKKPETNQTIIELQLKKPLFISRIKLNIASDFDYQRPVNIKYIDHRVRAFENCDNNCFQTAINGFVSSERKNTFDFKGIISNKLKILIENKSNQPLTIDNIEVSGYVNELHARFTQPADYFLVYGSELAKVQSYDIKMFADKIPTNLTPLKIGEEVAMVSPKESEEGVLDNLFLWIVCGIIAVTIGWSTIKMILQK